MRTQRTHPPEHDNREPGGPAAPEVAALGGSAELIVDSFGDYVQAWRRRIAGGDSGMLPILLGLVLIVVIFQSQSSKFLSAGNLVNLFVQGAVVIMLGLGETYALLLSEIDLSIGYVAAVGGFITAELVARPYSWPWLGAVLFGLGVTAVIGLLQGSLITRLRLPSFIVTLGGLLGWQGVMLWLADRDKSAVGGVISISPASPIYKLVNHNMSVAASWIVLVVAVGLFAALMFIRTLRRRSQGLAAPPLSITAIQVGLTAICGVVLVVICTLNRGTLTALRGVPWVLPFVGIVVVAYTVLLGRTRFGRYIYAIGANPEAARRAGINVAMIRTLAFTMCAFTGGLAGLIYESRLGSMATDIDGGTLVLYAVAAAVIGGTSLFGGRGKAVYAVIGGLVIAAVENGLALLGIGTAGVDMATALVLIGAVAVDSLLRKRGIT
jgi:D-xylose transport system permease protein